MNNEKVIAVICVDHRMHKSKSDFRKQLEESVGSDEIYEISFAGPDGLVTQDDEENRKGLESLEYSISRTEHVLMEHGHQNIRKVVVGHSDCAGCRCDDKTHVICTKKLADRLTQDLDLTVGFTPLMAYKVDEDDDLHWTIERLQ